MFFLLGSQGAAKFRHREVLFLSIDSAQSFVGSDKKQRTNRRGDLDLRFQWSLRRHNSFRWRTVKPSVSIAVQDKAEALAVRVFDLHVE